MTRDPYQEAVDRGIAFVKAHTDLSFEFNVLSKPGFSPLIVNPLNQAALELDKAILGSEDFSGASYTYAFSLFLKSASDHGLAVNERPNKTITVRVRGSWSSPSKMD